MRSIYLPILAVIALAACAPDAERPVSEPAAEDQPAAVQADPMPVVIEAALADRTRPDEDRLLDVNRHPAEVLAFAGLEHGWRVADIVPGNGYYARVLSAAVGEEGHVYAFNPTWVATDYPAANDALQGLADSRDNMSLVVDAAESFDTAIGTPLDAVFMVLFYHDTAYDGTDRPAMNSAIYNALRPGGVYIVIDHHAPEGSGLTYVNDTHRIDAGIVRDEIMAAGFVLDAESDMLANPDDDHLRNVFDPDIRRHTDRFVYRFRKPE
jgi:predicted methyltransferase